AFLVAYCSTPVLRRLAVKFDILDRPNRRKMHKHPVPLLGGLAIYLGLVSGLILNQEAFGFLSNVLIGATIILVIGLIDDILGLSAQIRLIGQLLAALIMISSGIRLTFLPESLWGDATEIILTLIWIVGITNALNYLDGIDGLAAGLSAISAFFLAIISYQTGQLGIGLVAVVLMASCLGFLPHNFKRAKVFLGDAGSTFLGFILAGIAVQGDWAEDNIVKLAVPILILAIPIFDMVLTTIMRIREAKVSTFVEWLKYGGKDHFHHRLISLGLLSREATFFIYFVSISFGINAIMVSNEKAIVGILSILQASIVLGGITVLMLIGRRLHK
ncbi:MAG: undecaprenyl/decaprenyl-phosphate alpha-N-acetylglucosaminyl 1-phosphate transferase, partial [Candidatus Omnitrophica bacterium]|nr:undecaprenyl/decaprenyl-phosphate alpha-N-acetylglucosaminyl 1-phosphate transferase [Candidatus Omnitrophota bacterium]